MEIDCLIYETLTHFECAKATFIFGYNVFFIPCSASVLKKIITCANSIKQNNGNDGYIGIRINPNQYIWYTYMGRRFGS